MSFGFSVGDFLTLSNIAWNLYNSFKDASREFKDVAAQVNSLHLILQSTADHLLNQPLRCKEVAELASLKTRCQDTLSDIDCLMRRHNSLGTRKPRRWDIVKWGLKDTAQVKGQLVFQATVLTALIASLTQFSQARVEENLDMLIQKIDEDRHCGTCVAERCRTIPAASETVHDAELLTFDDSSEAWLPTPASTNQGSPSSPSSATFAIDSTSALHSGRGHVYQRATSAGDSLQINGDVVGTLPNVRQLNNHYVDMAASEKSKQFNGNLDLEVILELLKIQG